MYSKTIILLVPILAFVACLEKEKTSNSAEDAFAKIDKKTESLRVPFLKLRNEGLDWPVKIERRYRYMII